MNRLRLATCLIAIAAIGCSSNPPLESSPATQSMTAVQSPEQQSEDLAAPPTEEATLAEQAFELGTQAFLALVGAQPDSAGQTPREQYEHLSTLPEAESRAIQFNLGSQTFDYFEDGEMLVSGPIASGKTSSPTPTGQFAILSKEKDKESSLYTNEIGTQAWMPYSMQFYGNYFVHEGWLPGHPASHGCIRVGHHHAKLLFERMKLGDPVTVSN